MFGVKWVCIKIEQLSQNSNLLLTNAKNYGIISQLKNKGKTDEKNYIDRSSTRN